MKLTSGAGRGLPAGHYHWPEPAGPLARRLRCPATPARLPGHPHPTNALAPPPQGARFFLSRLPRAVPAPTGGHLGPLDLPEPPNMPRGCPVRVSFLHSLFPRRSSDPSLPPHCPGRALPGASRRLFPAVTDGWAGGLCRVRVSSESGPFMADFRCPPGSVPSLLPASPTRSGVLLPTARPQAHRVLPGGQLGGRGAPSSQPPRAPVTADIGHPWPEPRAAPPPVFHQSTVGGTQLDS